MTKAIITSLCQHVLNFQSSSLNCHEVTEPVSTNKLSEPTAHSARQICNPSNTAAKQTAFPKTDSCNGGMENKWNVQIGLLESVDETPAVKAENKLNMDVVLSCVQENNSDRGLLRCDAV